MSLDPAEVAAAQAANAIMVSLVAKAQTALSANQAFLSLSSPTNAQVLAQVQLMTRELNALIRLATGQLDSTAGT